MKDPLDFLADENRKAVLKGLKKDLDSERLSRIEDKLDLIWDWLREQDRSRDRALQQQERIGIDYVNNQ